MWIKNRDDIIAYFKELNTFLQTLPVSNPIAASKIERIRSKQLADLDDLDVNNNWLFETTIAPSAQASGRVWGKASTNFNPDHDFLNPKKRGAKRFLMIIHIGQDIHEINFFMESFKVG